MVLACDGGKMTNHRKVKLAEGNQCGSTTYSELVCSKLSGNTVPPGARSLGKERGEDYDSWPSDRTKSSLHTAQ